jgi:hypothetical protein
LNTTLKLLLWRKDIGDAGQRLFTLLKASAWSALQDNRIFNTMMIYLGKQGELACMQCLFEEMWSLGSENKNCKPDVSTYNIMLEYLCNAGLNITELKIGIKELLENMKQKNIAHDTYFEAQLCAISTTVFNQSTESWRLYREMRASSKNGSNRCK